MNYTELGVFVESLMASYVKGEIGEIEFVQSVDEKVNELKKIENKRL